MERYDSYKNSGVEWIGKIPTNWSKIKIKNTVDPNRKITYGIVQPGKEDPNGTLMIRGKDYSNGWVDVSEVFRVSSQVEIPYSRSRVKRGDIVYTIVGGVGNVEVVPEEYEGSNLTQTTGRISVKDGIISKWVYHSLQSELNPVQIKLSQVGSVIPGISLDTLKNFFILLPPISEQQQIVSFLDTKTSLIDSLIEKTQRKIKLLKEKRTSLINEVVTKGLNPNVEMKDSGVKWIGEIPSHWELKKFKHFISKIIDNRGRTPELVESGIPYIEVKHINGDSYHPNFNTDNFITQNTYDTFLRGYLEEGDVLFSTVGSVLGKTSIFPPNKKGCIIQNVVGFRFNNSYVPIYMMFQLRTFVDRNHDLLVNNSNFQGSIKVSTFRENFFISPPFSEQNEIVSYLDEQTQLIDKTISIEEKRIELLKEYRQSLISEVVTGKRKVVV